MNGDLLRIVDSIRRDKNIDPEIVFSGIEAALITAAKKHFGDEEEIDVKIDRGTGQLTATHSGKIMDAELLGRISAQTAKQIIIQKIREAERDAVFDEFTHERGVLITGAVQRVEPSGATVNIGKTEAFLPRGEMLQGEQVHPSERIKAVIIDVRKSGQRVKIILSRTHHDFVRRLFEQEIPEVAEHIIEIKAIAREAGHRTKVAVSSIDGRVDCVGACVGVRGGRIKNILDELGGERVDIIRWNESLQVMIPNALSPAVVEEVQFYDTMGRAIVLVKDDQLSLAIGKRGQNVRLASKLCGIDIEIMTFDELGQMIETAEENFTNLPGGNEEIIEALIEEGIFTHDDLSVMEPERLMEVTGLDEDAAMTMIEFSEKESEKAPAEQSTRSSMLTGSPPGPRAPTAVDELLGPAEEIPVEKPKTPSVKELFGDVPKPKTAEKKITAADLFGETTPIAEEESERHLPRSPLGE